MNIEILSVVTPSSIYHIYYTWKTFWEEHFTLVNMKNCGCRNVSKHREIKDGEKYTTLYISLGFGSLENIEIASSYKKSIVGDQERGLLPLWVSIPLEGQIFKKASSAITNVSLKDI